jgi:site-specific DNA recombinase
MQFHDYSSPKNGAHFRVLIFGRISTDNQDEKSLEDQEQYVLQHLNRIMPGQKFEIKTIAGQGSGQLLDRAEFLQLCELVTSGKYDIVIAEDLARILRRFQVVPFLEEAEDSGTRVIAINDFLDTKDENWQQTAFFAAYKHSSFCQETSRRIRRTLRNRFINGGIVMCTQYGYIKPHPKASDEEMQKDPKAVPVYETWISMLENGATYAEVARLLKSENIPTGKYCSSRKWTVAMVKRLTYNPILKGERHRNKKMTKRLNKTGRPKSIDAPPDELLVRKVPHLAFVEPARWDRLIRQLDERNKKFQRSKERKNDPRADIPKRHTRWPGQHICCGVCGRFFVHGGHGKKERMMCNGAREHTCWNSMTIDAAQVANAVAADIRELVRSLPSFNESWALEYEAQRSSLLATEDAELERVAAELAKEERALKNLLNALAELGSSAAVVEKIRSSESNVQLLRDRAYRLERDSSRRVSLPNLDEIIAVADKSFVDLAVASQDFGRMMKSVVTEFFVLPYRLADGGHVQPKIMYRACLAPLVDHPDLDLLKFDRIIDLTKKPTRLCILDDVVELVNAGSKHAEVAAKLDVFKTEVGYAMRLHRRMKELGTDDPWVPVTDSEHVIDYFKKIRNPQFKFEPLDGFEVTRHPKVT